MPCKPKFQIELNSNLKGNCNLIKKKESNHSKGDYHPIISFFFLALIFFTSGCSDSNKEYKDFIGRWNLIIFDTGREYPAWVEFTEIDGKLEGRYVSGREGSARPIPNITYEGDSLIFSLPPQYENQDIDLLFKGWFGDELAHGYTFNPSAQKIMFSGTRAPKLDHKEIRKWDEPVDLLKDTTLAMWHLRYPDSTSGWSYSSGILRNLPPSEDLISNQKFMDFRIEAEYRTAENSNSGLYLRGRYEVQIMNNPDKLTNTSVGGIYGFIKPEMRAAKSPGEWNNLNVTLIGRTVTIILNGDTTAFMQEIPGITGGALDSREAEPGPIMLQGDHREIEFRKIIVTPGK